MKSVKGHQVNNKNIFYYLRILIYLFRTIFYIPLIEIFFTVIVCDKNYFNDNIKCWNSEHIIYFILCTICFLFKYYYHIYLLVFHLIKQKNILQMYLNI